MRHLSFEMEPNIEIEELRAKFDDNQKKKKKVQMVMNQNKMRQKKVHFGLY